jgi:transglutaminase-like putative cysteine protease
MSIHVALHHRTSYRYDRPVMLGPQSVRLRPAPHCRSRVLSYSLKVSPERHFINWQQDPQANHIARLVFPEPTSELDIEVDLVVEMAAMNPFDFFLEPYVETWPFEYDESLREELAPYRRCSMPSWPRSPGRSAPPTTSWSASTRTCPGGSSTASAWSPGCRPRRRRCRSAPAPAATAAGCW